MLDDKITMKLASLAKKFKSCQYGLDGITAAKDFNGLIELLKSPKGVEFCMKEQFPPISFLREFEDELKNIDVFLSSSAKLINPSFVIVFGGTTTISLSDFHVCEVYATGDAHVIVECFGNSYCVVETHGASKCEYSCKDDSRLNIYRKGKDNG